MKFEEGNIYFSKIIIIQSLPDNERKTGTELHDDNIARKVWFDPNLKTEIINISSKPQLFKELERIHFEAKQKIAYPYIHFETHGTRNGISLKSGEEAKWSELIPFLLNINLQTRNNLFISVSSCWGGNIQYSLKIYDPCPVRGFIGPNDKIYPSELMASFTGFFDELLQLNDFEKAIDRLNFNNNSGIEFHHTTAEAFFDSISKNPNKENIIDQTVNNLWELPKTKATNNSKSELRDKIKKESIKRIPELTIELRDRFLHKSL